MNAIAPSPSSRQIVSLTPVGVSVGDEHRCVDRDDAVLAFDQVGVDEQRALPGAVRVDCGWDRGAPFAGQLDGARAISKLKR
jgi:hypothetical protein